MFRGGNNRGRGSRRGFGEKVPLKGLFADGIWQCDCDPRLPADHFQTKNGGKNHGRWFYTCQKPQPKRCSFFLWDDEAKPRETTAVLNNSRSEPLPQVPARSTPASTVTPKKRISTPELLTPYSASKAPHAPIIITSPSQQSTQSTTSSSSPQEEFYDWPSTANEDAELLRAADLITMPPPPETPRKILKTGAPSTPGKRRYDEMAYPITPATEKVDGNVIGIAKGEDDIFATPANGSDLKGHRLFATAGLPSPANTPTPQRFRDVALSGPSLESELAAEVLEKLQELAVPLDVEAVAAVKQICGRYEMRLKGVAKGRDISRMALKTKDEKLTELQGKLAALEAEREAQKAVVRHLRRDLELMGRIGRG